MWNDTCTKSKVSVAYTFVTQTFVGLTCVWDRSVVTKVVFIPAGVAKVFSYAVLRAVLDLNQSFFFLFRWISEGVFSKGCLAAGPVVWCAAGTERELFGGLLWQGAPGVSQDFNRVALPCKTYGTGLGNLRVWETVCPFQLCGVSISGDGPLKPRMYVFITTQVMTVVVLLLVATRLWCCEAEVLFTVVAVVVVVLAMVMCGADSFWEFFLFSDGDFGGGGGFGGDGVAVREEVVVVVATLMTVEANVNMEGLVVVVMVVLVV
ncbi:hypothetical protein E2C01_074818 [Portunus trituberculatus]|uniref:Transmembrane protein n=1 Tax=Portunus trituberculatus TaxID=210409 RepID=A0A5B7II75_PORTR|nr:hypothetical protein [Portunus trituberculatus]